MQTHGTPHVELAMLEYGIVEEHGVYGIRIDAATAHSVTSKTIRSITPDLTRAIALMGLLWKRGVSPVHLEEVLEELSVLPGSTCDTGSSTGTSGCT